MELKFTQTGKYLIAAGGRRDGGAEAFNPVLYISVMGEKGWATCYPVAGRFPGCEEAAAAALHYGIQIITKQIKDVRQPDH